MSTWEFTLAINGVDLQDEEVIERLFASGLDDATVSRTAGVQLVDITRETESYGEALFSALEQLIAAAPGVRILRVEPDQLLTMAEIAERYDRTRESVRLLIVGQRGPGGFPPPLSHYSQRTRLWRWGDVVAWFRAYLSEEPVGDTSKHAASIESINAAVNARLEWERYFTALHETQRSRLEQIASASYSSYYSHKREDGRGHLSSGSPPNAGIYWLEPKTDRNNDVALAAKSTSHQPEQRWVLSRPFKLEGTLWLEWTEGRIHFRVQSTDSPRGHRVVLVARTARPGSHEWRSEAFEVVEGAEIFLGDGLFLHEITELGVEVVQ